jgi:hypothetical protein
MDIKCLFLPIALIFAKKNKLINLIINTLEGPKFGQHRITEIPISFIYFHGKA